METCQEYGFILMRIVPAIRPDKRWERWYLRFCSKNEKAGDKSRKIYFRQSVSLLQYDVLQGERAISQQGSWRRYQRLRQEPYLLRYQ